MDGNDCAGQVSVFAAFDLVLLDVEMPGLDGFAACALRYARRMAAGFPVILVTGRSDPLFIERPAPAGVCRLHRQADRLEFALAGQLRSLLAAEKR